MSDRQARINKTIPVVQLLVGTYAGPNDDGTVQVDFGQGEITVYPVGATSRTDGEQVRVLQVNGASVVLGPASQSPPYGTVSATPGGGLLTVSTEGGDFTLPYVTTYSPTIGDEVAIIGGWVVGEASVIQSSDYTPPGAPSTSGTRTLTFKVSDTGTWYVPGGSYNRTEVYAVGTGNNIGAFFYGTTIRDTIPDSATINKVEIYMSQLWSNFPGTPTALGLHERSTKSGIPSIVSATSVSTGSGWRTLPTSFGDSLKTGAKFGIGTGTSGEAMYRSKAQDASSGALRITYTT